MGVDHGDQGWKETRRFPDRQVSTQGTEKAQIEALTSYISANFVKNSKVWAYPLSMPQFLSAATIRSSNARYSRHASEAFRSVPPMVR